MVTTTPVPDDMGAQQPSQEKRSPSFQTETATESTPVIAKKKGNGVWKLILRIFIFLLVVGGVFGFAGWVSYLYAKDVISAAQSVEMSAQDAYATLKAQNLKETDEKIRATEEKFVVLRQKYEKLGWMKAVPFAGAYYMDGVHALNAGSAGIEAARMTVQAVEPYADVLGFSGEGTFTGGSIENRIKLMLGTLSKVTPIVGDLASRLDTVGKELSYIDEMRYPESVRGVVIRERIRTAKMLSAGASEAVVRAKPVFEVLPFIAGSDGKRKKYLVLFQNDNELRPTGGFMTAYATLFIEDGRVTPEKSDDIYELDKKFRNKPEIPPILKQYLKTETRWNLRDMNLSPDFKNSMDVFWSYFQKIPNEPKDIDGIIAVDTNVLEKLVEILGPVDVPGYGIFSAENDKRCDCPQIIYALSEIVDRPTPFVRVNRKGIIGPMMQAILAKAYSAPKQLWPQLFGEAWKSVEGKHVQFYFFDEKTQTAAESIGAAGRVVQTPKDADYVFVVDANLGGAKSNLFVQQQIEQDVDVPSGGRVKKTLTLTYKNPFPPSNCNLEAGELCLNGTLTDWVRVYLPKDAEVSDALGFDTGTGKVSQELDHTVYEGVFVLQPKTQAKIKITYTVPYTDTKEYRLFVQKQGGSPAIKHTMRVNGGEQEVVVDKDQLVKIPF
ncbi:MAG TPA: DUF4012 domain-containing protein [Patescibacteria group bacterium]|nr:DUF4012 domain-containing protein [Patescibacteria group bacterium]